MSLGITCPAICSAVITLFPKTTAARLQDPKMGSIILDHEIEQENKINADCDNGSSVFNLQVNVLNLTHL